MLGEQAVLWAGLHQILVEDSAEGKASLQDVERRLAAVLLAKAALETVNRSPLEFSWAEAETLAEGALPRLDAESDESLTAALQVILEDPELREKYEVLLRALAFASLEVQQTHVEAWMKAMEVDPDPEPDSESDAWLEGAKINPLLEERKDTG